MKNREQGKSDVIADSRMRLFFALWPTPPMQEALHRAALQRRDVCGGRVMRAASIHLTLLFLGETLIERLADLMQAAAAVHASRFGLDLDQIRGWRHNGIVYAAPRKTPDPLLELTVQLRAKMVEVGIDFDARAFAPHVTLMRNSKHIPQPGEMEPIHWQIEEFVLVRSVPQDTGMGYEIIGRWPLR